MVNVLLTGGNGFIASHILDILVQKHISVTFTVRSKEVGDHVLERYKSIQPCRLQAHIVSDFTAPGAFDECFKSSEPFDAVLHVASPFKYSVTDIDQELLAPSVIGTQSLLTAVHNFAPSVKSVILTSSFAAILDSHKPNTIPNHTCTTSHWNSLTRDDAFRSPLNGYRASKLFAERAAWDFMETHKPSFSLVAMCPTLAFGPLVQPIHGGNDVNTSSQRILSFVNGSCRAQMPDTGVSFYLWADVRDVATAHVRAMERQLGTPESKRYLLTAGYFTNKNICEIIGRRFPEYLDVLPRGDGKGGFPKEGVYKYDDRETTDELQMDYRGLEESVVDAVNSLKNRGYV